MLRIVYVNQTPSQGTPADRNLQCGEAFDMVRFVLSGTDLAEQTGAVIQMVVFDIHSKRSPGPDVTDNSGYFEVWDVFNGVVMPAQYDFAAGPDAYNDRFLLADPSIVGKNSKGFWSITGWAIYVPRYDWEKGPDKWFTQFDAGHDPRAGPLPTRPLSRPPSVWTPLGAVQRVLKVVWNCYPRDVHQATDFTGSGII
jgi:hypothetical protein